MSLKKFNEYSQDLKPKKVEKIVEKKAKKVEKKAKKVNEASFLVGEDYKVKSTFDVPKLLVNQYIEKVIEETGRNPLDNFNEAEVAEQMVDYVVKQNMIIDNLPSDFTVGSEDSSDLENSNVQAEADSEELSSDMGEVPDEEFDIESGSEEASTEEVSDDGQSGDIDFGMEESDIDEEIEVDDTEVETETETDSSEEEGFEEIEFESEETETESGTETETETDSSVQTVGDYLKKLNSGSGTEEETTEEKEEEEEETVENLYKKIGYDTGYFESLNINSVFNRN